MSEIGSKKFDLITIGEALLRFSTPAERLIVDTPSFDVHVGGAENNVAAAVSRMGYRVRWLSRLPKTLLGERVIATVGVAGVDCRAVQWADDGRLGLYYFENGAPPRPSRVIYDRQGSTASQMHPGSWDFETVEEARLVHLTGITAALSEPCYQLIATWIDHCFDKSIPVIFDVNFRSLLWSADICRQKLDPLLRRVDTVIVSSRDATGVFGLQGSDEEKLQGLYDRFGTNRIAMTTGRLGALGLERGKMVSVPSWDASIIDRIGAGDAFAAGVICGLLEQDFALGIRYAVAMSTLQLTLAGDVFRLSKREVLQLMEAENSGQLIR